MLLKLCIPKVIGRCLKKHKHLHFVEESLTLQDYLELMIDFVTNVKKKKEKKKEIFNKTNIFQIIL